MLEQITIGLGSVSLTTVVLAFFMLAGIRFANRHRHGRSELRESLAVWLFTAWMFLEVLIETLLWAAVYLVIPNPLANRETAMYFSMETFTTVGYGDVALTGSARMLSLIQAANGMIIFGWTTALIFDFIEMICARSKPKHSPAADMTSSPWQMPPHLMLGTNSLAIVNYPCASGLRPTPMGQVNALSVQIASASLQRC